MCILIYMFKTLVKMFYSQELYIQSNSHIQWVIRFAHESTESKLSSSMLTKPAEYLATVK